MVLITPPSYPNIAPENILIGEMFVPVVKNTQMLTNNDTFPFKVNALGLSLKEAIEVVVILGLLGKFLTKKNLVAERKPFKNIKIS
jgi:hypothetical protein